MGQNADYQCQRHHAHQKSDRFLLSAKPYESSGHHNDPNPLATILSAAMMLRYSLNDEASAARIEAAVSKVLRAGLRTADIARAGERSISTAEMGAAVVAAL